MPAAQEFLKTLAIVLGIAAATTVLFQRLRQPVVLGYILAGLIVGPHVPVPLVADEATVHTLSELGVILLMFSLGLEFSLRRLIQVGPTAGITALIQCSLLGWLGFLAGRLLGWTVVESLFAGAAVAISSTTIIAKAFDEQGIGGKLRELVVGVLIVEDLIAILLMAVLTAVSAGERLSAGDLAWAVLRLAGFLGGLVAVGLLVIPPLMRAVCRLGRAETTLVASIGLCFAVALLAQAFGYSVALGAFLAGSLVAESGEGEKVSHLIRPVRDMFAAVFFVSVGMMLDPKLLVEHRGAVAAFLGVVLVGKIAGVSLGAFLTGHGTRLSVQAGMSLAQIGEFSFIIAGLGLSLGATRDFLYPVAVAVSALTTLSTPWLIRGSGPAANWVDRKMPRALQTFAALYGSWLERLRFPAGIPTVGRQVRRLVLLLLLDALILAAVVVGASLGLEEASVWLAGSFHLSPIIARMAVAVGAMVLSLPFVVGIVRVARGLGSVLAVAVLPPTDGGTLDLAAAPRRALLVALQLAIVLLVGVPFVALTQPFLPRGSGAAVLLALVVGLGWALWRRAADLQGHVRAGAATMVEALSSRMHQGESVPGAHATLERVHRLLPGLGDPVLVSLTQESSAAGRSLAELNLRGVTGATIIAVLRGEQPLFLPSGREVLKAGDELVLAGSHEAVEAARAMLAGSQPRL